MLANAVTPAAIPPQSGIGGVYKSLDLADAFAIPLPADAIADPELLARFIFTHQPPWIGRLTKLRDLIVAGFGLKTTGQLAALAHEAKAQRVGIFKIYSTSESEIVLGEDDKHLDFRLSVLCRNRSALAGGRELIVSTVVHCHNRLGRAYIFVIAPFHRRVVRASLRHAAEIGWPLTAGSQSIQEP